MGLLEERERELERLKSQNNTPLRSPYNREYSRTTTSRYDDYRKDDDNSFRDLDALESGTQ